MTDCLFCKIARGEIPAKPVAENSEFMAFRDIAPQAPTHVLVIPRKHLTSLNDLEDAATSAGLLAMARQVARQEGLTEKGYRCVINTGDEGGQSVHHLHLHVLGGRQMKWPPG